MLGTSLERRKACHLTLPATVWVGHLARGTGKGVGELVGHITLLHSAVSNGSSHQGRRWAQQYLWLRGHSATWCTRSEKTSVLASGLTSKGVLGGGSGWD